GLPWPPSWLAMAPCFRQHIRAKHDPSEDVQVAQHEQDCDTCHDAPKCISEPTHTSTSTSTSIMATTTCQSERHDLASTCCASTCRSAAAMLCGRQSCSASLA